MEDNPFPKKYRRLKYLALALFIFTAVGIFIFSKDRQQMDNPRAEVKEATSSLTADAGQQGEKLMEKAGEIKDSVNDKLAKGRDKAAVLASDSTDKAGEMVQSATDTGAQLAGRFKSAAESKEGSDTNVPAQGNEADRITKGLSAATSGVKKGSMNLFDTNKLRVDTNKLKADADKGTVDNESARVATGGRKQINETIGQKDSTSGSTVRCIGSPPMGKDLGRRYIVASCETMSIISERIGVGLDDLKDHNPQLSNPDLIYPKQVLRLPPRG